MNALESAKIDLKHARAQMSQARTREETAKCLEWAEKCKERVEQLQSKEIYAFKNTKSQAGRPEKFQINPCDAT